MIYVVLAVWYYVAAVVHARSNFKADAFVVQLIVAPFTFPRYILTRPK